MAEDYRFSTYKVLAHPEKILQLKVAGDITPATVYLELTNRCTFNCPWCPIPRGSVNLDTNVVLDTIEYLAKNKVKSVVLTGGEPMLHPDFIKIVKRLRTHGIDVGVETAGELITTKNARFLIANVSWIKIPIETFDSTKFNRLRQCTGPRIENILRNIKSLVDAKKTSEAKCDIIVELKYFRQTVVDAHLMPEYCLRIGVDILYIKPMRYKEGHFFVEEINDVVLLQEKVWYNTFKVVCNPSCLKANKARQYEKCLGHYFTTYIASDGGVYLCRDRKSNDFCFGYIHKASFSDIWDGLLRSDAIKNLDISKCPALCHCDAINTALQIIDSGNHKNFL
jgi:MoaA/NifB/PqqE/SkfB family radical SAM enzyme